MTWVFVILTVLVVAAIGLVSVGGVTARLASAPPRSVFDLDEAVAYVAERLPVHASGQLTYDELRRLLLWHLEYLEQAGVADESDDEDLRATPVGGSAWALVEDDEAVAYVLGRAADEGLEVDDAAVFSVIEVEGRYLAAIGAVGGAVE